MTLLSFILPLASRADTAPALVATYADGSTTITTLAATPNFRLRDNESLHPQLNAKFTATFDGVLKVTRRGKYTLDGNGLKIALDGKPYGGGAVDLDAGDHPIRLAFDRAAGPARAQLTWSSDTFAPEPVPAAALAHAQTPDGLAKSAEVERGRLLVEDLNCVACHHAENSSQLRGRQAPMLTDIGSRAKPDWIYHWLGDPAAFRHGASMPKLALSDDDRRDVATYLGGLKKRDDKTREQPQPSRAAAGKALFETVGCKGCHAAANLSLDGLGSKWLTAHLGDYLQNPLAVDPSGRMPSLLLSKDEALDVAEYLVKSKKEAFEAKLPAGGDVKHGEQIVRSQGCLQCHVVEPTRGQPLKAEPTLTAVPLEKLTSAKGCLADAPSAKAMDYHLAPDQRAAIVAFVDSIRAHPLISAAPTYEFTHAVATFRCTACHELDAARPGPDVTERIPALTNVGGKLRKEWINEVLTQKRRVRPWLKRRMPEFGPANVGHVAEFAAATAGVDDAEPLPVPSRDEIIAGQNLVGSGAGGLGCMTCHGFHDVPPPVAEDTRGPDLTSVAGRLRPDHFRRWVLDPKRVSPSTPMPSFFEGAPPDEAHARVDTIFKYVAMGASMPPPTGYVDKNNYTLGVDDHPVVMRAFMPNPAGGKPIPRGVAVGLPGLINYCFDADTCTLRYAWTGGFLDMKPSWSARGGNQVAIQGKPFYTSNVFPVRLGADATKPEFQGYEFGASNLPQMLYRVGPVAVRETAAPLPKDVGLTRTFEFDGATGPLTLTFPDSPNVTITTNAGALTADTAREPARIITLPAATKKVTVTFTIKDK